MKIIYLPKEAIVFWKVMNKGRKKSNDYMTQLDFFGFNEQTKS